MAEQDQQFIEYVVKNLVDHPEDVQIERTIYDRGVLLKLTVHTDDMGKVIGKAGSTAKAIRTLLRVVGSKTDERLNLKIVDPDAPEEDAQSSEFSQPEVAVDSGVMDEAEPSEETAITQNEAEMPDSEVEASDDLQAIKAKAREGLEDLDMDI